MTSTIHFDESLHNVQAGKCESIPRTKITICILRGKSFAVS